MECNTSIKKLVSSFLVKVKLAMHIVASVLDDGIDLNHDDFGDNLWTNEAEIPNNDIDDDNNGYIDDYLGWSIVSNSDNITGGGHGTPVAGIVGAQGNNSNGVTGVNWDVKVMVIKNNFNNNVNYYKELIYIYI